MDKKDLLQIYFGLNITLFGTAKVLYPHSYPFMKLQRSKEIDETNIMPETIFFYAFGALITAGRPFYPHHGLLQESTERWM